MIIYCLRFFLFVVLFINAVIATGQNNRVLTDLPANEVVCFAETYDGAMLLLGSDREGQDDRRYIFKYSMEGAEIWRKTLLNTFTVDYLVATRDSGFAVSLVTNLYPDSPIVDTSGYAALLKFDKCGKLQWARYVPTGGVGVYNIVEDSNSNLLVCIYGLNGFNVTAQKTMTVVMFDRQGQYLRSQSFSGIVSWIYNGEKKDVFYLDENTYLHLGKDTTTVYAVSSLKKLDEDLSTTAKTVIGYEDKMTSGTGPLIVNENEITEIGAAYYHHDGKTATYFSRMDLNLNPLQELAFDDSETNNLAPFQYPAIYGDSIIVSSLVYVNPLFDSVQTSLRMYKSDFSFVKEVRISQNWWSLPSGLVPISGKRLIQTVLNYDRFTKEYVSVQYLYDRNLNSLPWPTIPPTKGYDWACSGTIKDEIIYVDSVVTPVYVPKDTSKPDWSWLSVKEPKREKLGKIGNGWIVFPQPALNGEEIYLSPQGKTSIKPLPLYAQLYDMQGRLIISTTALPNGINRWSIRTDGVKKKGLYLIHLSDSQTGASLGQIKVLIQ